MTLRGSARFRAALRTPGAGPETPVRFIFAGDAEEVIVAGLEAALATAFPAFTRPAPKY